MDSVHQLLWRHGDFLGVHWTVWEAIGWSGNAIFASRFFVQWYATEKKRQVSMPVAFWWLSLVGALTLLCYALHDKKSVWIFAYAFTWIPYIRNLMIHYRHEREQRACVDCGVLSPRSANYCSRCGTKLGGAVTGARA